MENKNENHILKQYFLSAILVWGTKRIMRIWYHPDAKYA